MGKASISSAVIGNEILTPAIDLAGLRVWQFWHYSRVCRGKKKENLRRRNKNQNRKEAICCFPLLEHLLFTLHCPSSYISSYQEQVGQANHLPSSALLRHHKALLDWTQTLHCQALPYLQANFMCHTVRASGDLAILQGRQMSKIVKWVGPVGERPKAYYIRYFPSSCFKTFKGNVCLMPGNFSEPVPRIHLLLKSNPGCIWYEFVQRHG